MNSRHVFRAMQTLLVAGALAFAGAGFAAPRHNPGRASCADSAGAVSLGGSLNPLPGCQCADASDCADECFNECGGDLLIYLCEQGGGHICDSEHPWPPYGSGCGPGSCVGLCTCVC